MDKGMFVKSKGRSLNGFRGAVWAFGAVCLAGACAFPVQAAAVRKVSIKTESDFRIGEKRTEADVEVEAVSDLITVESVEIQNGLNQGQEVPDIWGNMDIPVVEVILTLDDSDHFSVKASDISVKGAKCLSGVQEDEQTLILRLEYPSLQLQVGEIPSAKWDSDHTVSWEKAVNVDHYELALYRDGQRVGTSYETSRDNTYDFGGKMTKEGTYTYKVRGVNIWDEDVKSQWVTAAGSVTIDAERASALRQVYAPVNQEGANGPGDPAIQTPSAYEGQYGWLKDDIGYWYRNTDGSYPREMWKEIEGQWYYFDSQGYRVTGWIHWNEKSYYCDPETGAMATNTVVQDGSNRRVDSTGAWIE